ncbi:MAG: shikimate dehydrogenase family protein [Bacteroidia bacterium]
MPRFALIGKKLGHSWSKQWFAEKFSSNQFKGYEYINVETDSIDEIRHIVQEYKLDGFNITIPYKRSILPFLDGCTTEVEKIGAVNTVKLLADGKLIGYNTDVFGFEKSITPLLHTHQHKALILGNGGASQAVKFILQKLNISFQMISRTKESGNESENENESENILVYADLTPSLIAEHTLIINTTPLGMYPNLESCPDIPYEAIGKEHLLFDLVYNPLETLFLKKARLQGAQTKNGEEMLHLQAERALEIWMEEG